VARRTGVDADQPDLFSVLGPPRLSWRCVVRWSGAASNGGTAAMNMLIEKARRLAHGYRNYNNYQLRMLLAASGTRTRRTRSPR